MIVINGTGDHQFMIRADTFPAENAFTEIPYNKRIDLFIGGKIRHGIEAGIADTQGCGNISEFTPVPFAADNTGFRVFRHHQADNIATVF